MSRSEVYQGNKFISRRLRQQTITLLRALEEIDDERAYEPVVIEGVQVIADWGVALSQRGIDTSDTCKVRIEMRDCDAVFDLNAGVDLFVVGQICIPNPTKARLEGAGHKVYQINKVNKITNIDNEVDIVEVYAA